MLAFKLVVLSVIFVLIYFINICESAGNYSIGFEKFGGNPTNPPRPNPTYRPVQPNTYRPPPQQNTYRPPPQQNTYRPPPQQIPTYRPTSAKPKTTTRPPTKRTTAKPTAAPKPTAPPLWNIWTSKYVPNQQTPLSTKIPTNTFKSDATLLGLYTIMRNAVDITLSQTGQTRPVKKPLHESYPYYYAVYHYYKDREKVSSRISIPFDSVGWCDAGTSDRTCVPGTYAMCLLDWTIMCVTYTTATFPCYFNTSLQCATGRAPCNPDDSSCSVISNQREVQTPCISTVVVASPRTLIGSITQNASPDPYAKLAPGPIELCATTLLELKKLESPLGAIVGLINEIGNLHVDFINNFNASEYAQPISGQPVTLMPRVG